MKTLSKELEVDTAVWSSLQEKRPVVASHANLEVVVVLQSSRPAPEKILPTYKFVVVVFVDVVFVKMAVEGLVPPMAMPLMVPPARVTDGEDRAPKAPTLALAVEPVAVVNRSVVANASVAVADVKTAVLALEAPIGELLTDPPEMVSASTTMASVTELEGSVRTPVTARLVVVVFVPVAFVQVRFVSVRAPVVNEAMVALLAKRFVVVTVVPVTEVKIAVEALVPPMAIPLIVPPDKVTEGELNAPKAPVLALAVDPVAVVNLKVVAKASVAVAEVKTPKAGVVAPIVVPLIVPPVMVAKGEDKAPNAPVFAFAVDPVAVVKRRVVAKRSVEVALVVVVYVKMAVEGVVAPMVVPLMVPPVTVTDGLVRLLALTVRAVSVVPEAVANPSQTVEVTPEKKALSA
jgi:hypothetical protein